MKLRKSILMALTIFGLLTLGAMNANAVGTWYTCSVVQAGPGWGVSYFLLTDTSAAHAFTGQWFSAPAAQANAFLGTALTAMSNNMNVRVFVDLSSLPNYPVLSALYMAP